MADPRFALAVGISVLSGAVRGFSGFGSALIYIPLMSALYGPQIGAATFLLIDFVTGIVFSIGVWRQAVWREVVPLVVAAAVAAQFGTLILQYADPVWLRWLMVGARAGAGRRARARAGAITAADAGRSRSWSGSRPALSAARCRSPARRWCCSGSPAMASAATVRANFMVFFPHHGGRADRRRIWRPACSPPDVLALAASDRRRCTSLAMWAGAQLFHLASETTYRRVAYVIITLAALVSMPLWDGWLR